MLRAIHQPTKRSPAHGPYRWKDFLALDGDDTRELEDGFLVESEMPTKAHQWVILVLSRFLSEWAEKRAVGIVLPGDYKIRISELRGVMPDVLFVRHDNPAAFENEGMGRGHPDLVVEIVSRWPSDHRRDRIRKRHDYATIGVPEFWLVEPDAQTLERLVLRDGQYLPEVFAGDMIFRPRTFPGLAIPLASLWNLPTPPKKRTKAASKKRAKKK